MLLHKGVVFRCQACKELAGVVGQQHGRDRGNLATETLNDALALVAKVLLEVSASEE